MNFLSHYYFDQTTADPYQVLGVVLPDLLKNADKSANIHPEKQPHLFEAAELHNILKGWQRHLQVDKLFHNSEFFVKHTGILKNELKPILVESPVRPSFLAHIAIELMLDH